MQFSVGSSAQKTVNDRFLMNAGGSPSNHSDQSEKEPLTDAGNDAFANPRAGAGDEVSGGIGSGLPISYENPVMVVDEIEISDNRHNEESMN